MEAVSGMGKLLKEKEIKKDGINVVLGMARPLERSKTIKQIRDLKCIPAVYLKG